MEATSPKPVDASTPLWAWWMVAAVGMSVELLPIGIRLLDGEPPADAFWPSALRALWLDFLLREQGVWLLVGLGLVAVLTLVERNLVGRAKDIMRLIGVGLMGWCLALLGTHVLLNWGFYRGAFILAPAGMALGILPITLMWGLDKEGKRILKQGALALGVVALLALTPALPAAMNLMPTPPPTPAQGYGAAPGPFLTETTTMSYTIPEQVLTHLEGEDPNVVSRMTVTWPVYTVEPPGLRVPFGLVFPGFGAPLASDYTDWTEHLAAKGMVVVHVAYPSHLIIEGQEEPVVAGGRSNHPQHALRMDAMASAMDVLERELLLSEEADTEGWLMGALIDPSALYLGGHSLGAGMAMMVAAAAMERGWATEALLVDLEQPYTHANDPDIYGSLTARPDATLVHVAIAEDDTSVDPCHGVGHAMRWHQEADIADVVLMRIPSDRHGFPPLIASHYLASTPVHDTLADHAFYRRVDAQAEWLVAMQRNDTFTSSFAEAHLLDHELLLPMGTWSDGTTVKPLEAVEAPFIRGPSWVEGCQEQVDIWS